MFVYFNTILNKHLLLLLQNNYLCKGDVQRHE